MMISHLVLVTQQPLAAAETLAAAIIATLGNDCVCQKIELYPKFENGVKLSFLLHLSGESIAESVRLTDKIARPWLIYYDTDTDSVEFIFNRNEHTTPSKEEFAVIRWANFWTT
jgi:hypothetical protein